MIATDLMKRLKDNPNGKIILTTESGDKYEIVDIISLGDEIHIQFERDPDEDDIESLDEDELDDLGLRSEDLYNIDPDV